MGTSQAKMPSSSGGFRKYLKDPARTTREYYDDGDGFGVAWGGLARRFGIENGLSDAQFDDLHAGRWNGETLTRSGYRKVVDPITGEATTVAHRTSGYDVTFMAPKEISALYARAATQQQADAIAKAVFDAAQVAWTDGVEAFARGARVRGDKVIADLIGVPVLQFTARPTDATEARNAPADVHLHVHTATFALCAVGEDYYQFDGAAIFRTAEYRDAIFMGELAQRIEALGYQLNYTDFEASRKGRVRFAPEGDDPALNRHWSSQTERSIGLAREFEASHGRPPTDRELRDLMRVTKSKKSDKDMDSHPTRERWISDARRSGFDASPLSPTAAPGGRHLDREAALKALGARLNGPKGIHRDGDAVFGPDAIAPAIARAAVGLGLTREDLASYEAAFMDELIAVRQAAEPAHRLFTTAGNLARENYVAATITAMASPRRQPVPLSVQDAAAARQPVVLDAEQRAAQAAACSTRGFVIWTGNAGSGKSTTARAAVDSLRNADAVSTVVATAVAAKRATEFGDSIRADVSGSIESVLTRVSRGSLTLDERTVVLIDEAALVDTFRMAELLKVASKGRVIAIGDDRQLSAIGTAGWFTESVAALGSQHLSRVHRQASADDVRDYEAIRQGRGEDAVASLSSRGRLHIADDAGTRLGAVMRDYSALRDRGYRADEIRQVIETSNNDVDLMNRFVQRDRIARGEVATSGFEVQDLEESRRWAIHKGDEVIFLRPVAERGQPLIPNGTTATVTRVAPSGAARVMLSNGRMATVHLRYAEDRQPLGLAYAQHLAKFQGTECNYVQAMPSLRSTNANAGYSQLTRAKFAAHVYLDRSEAPGQDPAAVLADAWSTHVEKVSARSLLNQAGQPGPRVSETPVKAAMAEEQSAAQRMAAAYEASQRRAQEQTQTMSR